MSKRLVLLLICTALLGPKMVFGQANELAQLALNIEKLAQLKSILKNLETSYSVLSNGYNTIKGISQGNFNLHKVFLDGLMEVSPVVKKYSRVPKIIEYQVLLVKEYKKAYASFKQRGTFSADQLHYMAEVYQNLLRLSLRNLDELITVTTAGKLRMSDDERLQAIDRIYEEMQDKLNFLRAFNHDNALLGKQMELEKSDLNQQMRIQGIVQ